MEFRMLVPIIPLFYLLTLRALSDLHIIHRMAARICFILLLGIAPMAHHLSDMYVPRPAISSIRSLLANASSPYGWIAVGKSLKQILPPDCRIGVTAAGAIPYYSGLYSVDMLGLNDIHISRNGMLLKTTAPGINPNIKYGVRQGHGRMGRYRYALNREINLLLMHPVVIPEEGYQKSIANILDKTQTVAFWREFLLDAYQFADTLTFVLLPVKDRFLITLYCCKSGLLDEYFLKQNFPRFVIDKDDWLRPFGSND